MKPNALHGVQEVAAATIALPVNELAHLRGLQQQLESARRDELLLQLHLMSFDKRTRPGVVESASFVSMGVVSRRGARQRARVVLSKRTNEEIRPLVGCINRLLDCTESLKPFEYTSM